MAHRLHAMICTCTNCISNGALKIKNTLEEEIEKRDLKDVMLVISSCAGFCSREPMITVEIQDESPVKYVDLTPEKANEILVKHVLGGKIVKEYALSIGNERIL